MYSGPGVYAGAGGKDGANVGVGLNAVVYEGMNAEAEAFEAGPPEYSLAGAVASEGGDPKTLCAVEEFLPGIGIPLVEVGRAFAIDVLGLRLLKYRHSETSSFQDY